MFCFIQLLFVYHFVCTGIPFLVSPYISLDARLLLFTTNKQFFFKRENRKTIFTSLTMSLHQTSGIFNDCVDTVARIFIS